jgi:hypothetical protein
MANLRSGDFMDTCSDDKFRVVRGVVSWWNYWNLCTNDHQEESMALINIGMFLHPPVL